MLHDSYSRVDTRSNMSIKAADSLSKTPSALTDRLINFTFYDNNGNFIYFQYTYNLQ